MGVRTTSPEATLYPSVFLLRRLALVLFGVFVPTKNWLPLAFIFMQVMYFCYLMHASAKMSKVEQAMELAHEAILLAFGYFLLFTTDFVPLIPVQYTYGWVSIYLVGLVMVSDLAYMIGNTVYNATVTKKRSRHLNKLAAATQRKIEQINASKKYMTQEKLDTYEYKNLSKLRFVKRSLRSKYAKKSRETTEQLAPGTARSGMSTE